MFQPQTYTVCLVFMFVSMVCWGSWANTLKLCPGYRFQLFYWDYVLGLVAGALLWGLTLGSMGSTGLPLLTDWLQTDRTHLVFALLGGAIFNVANLLLVAAIDIAGLAVAFPVGIGLALVVGAVSSYVLAPGGNPWMLFGGIALVVAAIVLDAIAYRLREAERRALSFRGVALSLVAGLLMGSFYPFVSRAMTGSHGFGPYAIAAAFAIGVAVCAVPVNYLLIESLQKFHYYFGDEFKVECPVGSGRMMTLWEVAAEISRRLVGIFRQEPTTGRRPVFGPYEKFQTDPHWNGYPLFHEYFHADEGRGCGASHQTGWTGLVAKLFQQTGEYGQADGTPQP